METQSIFKESWYLPKYFFATSGKALSTVSPLNAFDEALMSAGIAQCNLVPVSSILPANSREVEYVKITPGSIVFTILARIEGGPGETISAGVAWAFGESVEHGRYGIVVEAYGKKDRESLELELLQKIRRMAKVRKMKLEEIKTRIETIEEIPGNNYGSVIAAVVFVPPIDYNKVLDT